jgi:hypothetical protein
MFDVLMLVASIVFAYLAKYLAKSEKLKHIALATEELEGIVVSIVGELQQTTVDGLKEAAEDGKLSKDEIAALGIALVNKAKSQLSNPAADTLTAAGVDIEGMIHSIAEACIASIKAE